MTRLDKFKNKKTKTQELRRLIEEYIKTCELKNIKMNRFRFHNNRDHSDRYKYNMNHYLVMICMLVIVVLTLKMNNNNMISDSIGLCVVVGYSYQSIIPKTTMIKYSTWHHDPMLLSPFSTSIFGINKSKKRPIRTNNIWLYHTASSTSTTLSNQINAVIDFDNNDPIIPENNNVEIMENISPRSTTLSFENEKGNNNNNSSQDQLLRNLDKAFSYTGRLSSRINNYNSTDDAPYRCGFVSIIGAPNMGKSTLLNALIEESLSIISDKPQTTRHSILGIISTNTSQICFYDTPGILDTPSYQLQTNMMETVKGAFRDGDVLIIVTDSYNTPIPSDILFHKVQLSNKPKIIIINKIDLFQEQSQSQQSSNNNRTISSLNEVMYNWRQLVPDAIAILPISAIKGSKDIGIKVLRNILTNDRIHLLESIRELGRPVPYMFLPQCYSTPSFQVSTMTATTTTELSSPVIEKKTTGSLSYSSIEMESTLLDIIPISPPLYDIEMYTDRTERFIASEMIRSILFTSKLLHGEIPYCCEVQVLEFKESSSVINIKQQSEANKRPGSSNSAPPRLQQQPLLRISADIIVERDSQKIIVVGKNGQVIKQVGILAREKLEAFFQSKVMFKSIIRYLYDIRIHAMLSLLILFFLPILFYKYFSY